MAKTHGPLFSLDASGAVASSIIYGRSKSGSTARKMRAADLNPSADAGSAGQLAQRQLVKDAIAYWHTMTTEQKAAYEAKARTAQITVYNAFLQDYLLNGPPTPPAVPAVWSPTDHASEVTIDGTGRNASRSGVNWNWRSARCESFKASGKWYHEITAGGPGGLRTMMGIATADADLNIWIGVDTYGYSYQAQGYLYHNSAYYSASTYGAGDVISVETDLDALTCEFFLNGTSVKLFTGVESGRLWTPAISIYDTADGTINTGQDAWSRPPGAGFAGWTA